jgi:15-cis-phytoene synthase
MTDAFAHCRQLVAQSDKERYWASLYAPANRRDGLYALYAFDLELAAVRERAREPMAGEVRLQWWREVLQGERAGEAAAHPVAVALTVTLQSYGIGVAPLSALVDARGFDLYDQPMGSVADFENHAAAISGAVLSVAAKILGVDGSRAEALCRETGLAVGYAGAMHELPRHASRGQLYIPKDILDHYDGDRAAILDGKPTFELRAALAEMRLRARRHLGLAAALLPYVAPEILPALLPVALIKPSLARMENRGYDPFRPRDIPLWRRQWLIWRAARDPRRIFR